MKRRLLGILAPSFLLFFLIGFLGAQAADVPVVLQPTDSAFSSSDRAVLLAAAEDVERILRQGYPIGYSRLASSGWLDRDFVVFAAGTLQFAGYEIAVVEGSDGSGGNRLWILVGFSLGERVGWIPVEATPSEVGAPWLLGRIPWAGVSGSEFDASYLAFERVVGLAVNAAPTARIARAGAVVVDELTSFSGRAEDRDGTIIAYAWSVDGEALEVSTNFVLRYTFTEVEEYELTLVVFDDRGAQATATEIIEVLADRDCSCSN